MKATATIIKRCANCAHYQPSKADHSIGDCQREKKPVFAYDLRDCNHYRNVYRNNVR